jgi:Ankyrin repeats (3 copies)
MTFNLSAQAHIIRRYVLLQARFSTNYRRSTNSYTTFSRNENVSNVLRTSVSARECNSHSHSHSQSAFVATTMSSTGLFPTRSAAAPLLFSTTASDHTIASSMLATVKLSLFRVLPATEVMQNVASKHVPVCSHAAADANAMQITRTQSPSTDSQSDVQLVSASFFTGGSIGDLAKQVPVGKSKRFIVRKSVLDSALHAQNTALGSGATPSMSPLSLTEGSADDGIASTTVPTSLTTDPQISSLLESLRNAETRPLADLMSHTVAEKKKHLRERSAHLHRAYRVLLPDERNLIQFVRRQQVNDIRDLLSSQSSTLNINAQIEPHGATALHIAAQAGNVELLALLLDHGATIDATAENNSTPLMWAAGAGNFNAVKFLISRNADVHAESCTWSRSVFGKGSGQTPLHWASESGHLDIVQLLTEHDETTTLAQDEQHASPLALALKEIHDDVSGYLKQVADDECVVLEVSNSIEWQTAVPPPGPHNQPPNGK